MLTAGAIMTPNLVTVRPDASVEEAIELMLREQVSGLPVLDEGGRLVGVITEFALLAIAYDRRVKNHTVSQHMTRDLITVEVDDPVNRVADLCIVHRVRRVPVIQNGRMVGVIARRDVLRALVENPLAGLHGVISVATGGSPVATASDRRLPRVQRRGGWLVPGGRPGPSPDKSECRPGKSPDRRRYRKDRSPANCPCGDSIAPRSR